MQLADNEFFEGYKHLDKLPSLMPNNLTPQDDRECPIYGKIIDGELCYETALCMQGLFRPSSISEAKDIVMPTDAARKTCRACKYADMGE